MHGKKARPLGFLTLAFVGLVVGVSLWLHEPPRQLVAIVDSQVQSPGELPVPSLHEPVQAVERDELVEPISKAPALGTEPEPPEEMLEEPGHPDPVELGPAALDLRLTDARSGEPVASHVELWRIDAPGNEHWTDGDQLQDQAHVPVEGWLLTRLPEGRYRLVCHAQAWDAQPPEIAVSAPRTRLDVAIELPRAFRVRVVVRDRYGRLVPTVFFGRERIETLEVSEPWRFERLPREGDMMWETVGWSDLGPALESSEGPQAEDGFDLGLYAGATRGQPERSVLALRTPEGARVCVRVPARADGDVHLVAVAVPRAEVADRVRMPGGGPAQAEVSVTGWAQPATPATPGGGWERAPLEIRARLEGYRGVELAWTVAQGELPWVELQPGP